MRVFTHTASDVEEVCRLLLDGEVVGIPTETVYGLAADALNPKAVERIYHIKNRPAFNPLIIHIGTPGSADRYVHLPAIAQQLMDAFWPGPLTLVLPKKPCIPDMVTAGLPTVGMRCPHHPLMQRILNRMDRPLAAPSANPSNYLSPTRVEHVTAHLAGRLQWVVDGGPCEKGVESTILDLSDPTQLRLLRPGPLRVEDIEAIVNRPVLVESSSASLIRNAGPMRPNSPGQLPLHYSPHTPLRLLAHSSPEPSLTQSTGPIARIHFSDIVADSNPHPGQLQSFTLTRNGDAREAERNLYALLQQLDQAGFSEIQVDPIPQGQQWNALRDRLTRAAAR